MEQEVDPRLWLNSFEIQNVSNFYDLISNLFDCGMSRLDCTCRENNPIGFLLECEGSLTN